MSDDDEHLYQRLADLQARTSKQREMEDLAREEEAAAQHKTAALAKTIPVLKQALAEVTTEADDLKERALGPGAEDPADTLEVLSRHMLEKGVRITDVFRRLEVSAGGGVKPRALALAFSKLDIPVPEARLTTLFRSMDADRNGTIEWPELNQALQKGLAARKKNLTALEAQHKSREKLEKKVAKEEANVNVLTAQKVALDASRADLVNDRQRALEEKEKADRATVHREKDSQSIEGTLEAALKRCSTAEGRLAGIDSASAALRARVSERTTRDRFAGHPALSGGHASYIAASLEPAEVAAEVRAKLAIAARDSGKKALTKVLGELEKHRKAAASMQKKVETGTTKVDEAGPVEVGKLTAEIEEAVTARGKCAELDGQAAEVRKHIDDSKASAAAAIADAASSRTVGSAEAAAARQQIEDERALLVSLEEEVEAHRRAGRRIPMSQRAAATATATAAVAVPTQDLSSPPPQPEQAAHEDKPKAAVAVPTKEQRPQAGVDVPKHRSPAFDLELDIGAPRMKQKAKQGGGGGGQDSVFGMLGGVDVLLLSVATCGDTTTDGGDASGGTGEAWW